MSDSLLSILIVTFVAAGVGAFVGALVIVLHDNKIQARQEKALLTLFIEEFILFFQRCTYYYKLFIDKGYSYSSLYQVSDSSSFTKLAEVTKSVQVIQRILELKSYFYRVSRHVEEAFRIQYEAQQKRDMFQEIIKHIEKAFKIQSETKINEKMIEKIMTKEVYDAFGKALAFFVGSFETGRNHYKDYIEKLSLLIDYLEHLDSKSKPIYCLKAAFPHLKREAEDLRYFIKENKQMVALLKDKIELLKEKERIVLAKKTSGKKGSNQI